MIISWRKAVGDAGEPLLRLALERDRYSLLFSIGTPAGVLLRELHFQRLSEMARRMFLSISDGAFTTFSIVPVAAEIAATACGQQLCALSWETECLLRATDASPWPAGLP